MEKAATKRQCVDERLGRPEESQHNFEHKHYEVSEKSKPMSEPPPLEIDTRA